MKIKKPLLTQRFFFAYRTPSWGVGGRRSEVGGSNPLMPTKYPKENQSVRVGFFVCGIWLGKLRGNPREKPRHERD
ncbi:hypothetical protein DVQ23_11710 [Yersinia enterocolitica]